MRELVPVVRTGVIDEDPLNDKGKSGRRCGHSGAKRRHRPAVAEATLRQQAEPPAILEIRAGSEPRSGAQRASPPAAGARLYGHLPRSELLQDCDTSGNASLIELQGPACQTAGDWHKTRDTFFTAKKVSHLSKNRVAFGRPFLFENWRRAVQKVPERRLFATVGRPHGVFQFARHTGPIDL